jgi:hypothetical protein
MPHPLLVLLFDFLQLFNCLILVFAVHITVSPTQRAPVLDIVPSHFTAPSSRLVGSGILPQRLHNTRSSISGQRAQTRRRPRGRPLPSPSGQRLTVRQAHQADQDQHHPEDLRVGRCGGVPLAALRPGDGSSKRTLPAPLVASRWRRSASNLPLDPRRRLKSLCCLLLPVTAPTSYQAFSFGQTSSQRAFCPLGLRLPSGAPLAPMVKGGSPW